MRTKLLVMASGFPPQKFNGGPATSLGNLVKYLEDYFEIYVICGNFDNHSDEKLSGVLENSWNNFSKSKVFYVNKEDYFQKNILKIIEGIEPDVIYQNSIFNAQCCLASLRYLKKYPKIKYILAPRGEFGLKAIKISPIKKRFYLLYLKIFKYINEVIWQGTSEQECKDINKRIGKARIVQIPNLPSKFDSEIMNRYKEDGILRMCYIGRIHKIKNLKGALLSLAEIKDNIVILYDIYGPMEDEQYWKECDSIIEKLPANIHVTYCGYVDNSKIREVLENYDAFFSPTFGENYGHSIVEAMLNRKIVFISDKTPWTDVKNNGGYAFDENDYLNFAKSITEVAHYNNIKYEEETGKINKFINDNLHVQENIVKYIKLFTVSHLNT